MFKPWRLVVRTPADTVLEAQGVTWLQVQLADGGPITILPGHAPLVAETVTALLLYVDGEGEHSVMVNAGLLHIARDAVTVYTTELGHADVQKG